MRKMGSFCKFSKLRVHNHWLMRREPPSHSTATAIGGGQRRFKTSCFALECRSLITIELVEGRQGACLGAEMRRRIDMPSRYTRSSGRARPHGYGGDPAEHEPSAPTRRRASASISSRPLSLMTRL